MQNPTKMCISLKRHFRKIVGVTLGIIKLRNAIKRRVFRISSEARLAKPYENVSFAKMQFIGNFQDLLRATRCAVIPCPRPWLGSPALSQLSRAPVPFCWGVGTRQPDVQISRAPVHLCWRSGRRRLFRNYPVPLSLFCLGGLGFDNPMCRYPVPPSLFAGGLGVAASFAIIPCPRPIPLGSWHLTT